MVPKDLAICNCSTRLFQNSAEKPHSNADCSVSSILQRSLVYLIGKPLLSRFITASRRS
jgi:hypothetical protein